MTEPVIFPALGFLGLNKERSLALLGPEWATEAQNAIIDSSGRLASRKGWEDQTTAPLAGSPDIDSLHEYIKEDRSTTLIAAANNKLYESSDNGATFTDRTGALVITSDNWQFQNFNNKVVGACAGHSLVVKTSGNFAAIVAASGTVPANPIAVLAAFGRVWALESDLQTIKYSALLDETRWDTADGAGTIDLRKVWTKGTDGARAIIAFAGRLVVFGERHIILWIDGRGNALGLDPEQIYVEDVIEGSGTKSRDSIQAIGESDVMFLGRQGIQSLVRVRQEEDESVPVQDVTKNSRQYFAIRIQNSSVDVAKIRSVYSAEEAFYLLIVPDANLSIYVDLRQPIEDGSYRIFEWPAFIPKAACCRTNKDILFGFDGRVGLYSEYLDDDTPYWYVIRSGFLDLQELNAALKYLKRIKVIATAAGGVTAIVRWWYDFGQSTYASDIVYGGEGVAEYGEAEYGEAEYGLGLTQQVETVPGAGSGQYFQLGIEVLIDGSPYALQVLQAYYDTGRLA